MSKVGDVETVETVEAGEETMGAETLSDQKLEGQQFFQLFAPKILDC